MSLSIVLLAAGEGKRMKTNLPKPLVMLGSDPLVQHSLDTIKKMKPDKTILVTGYKKDEVKKYVLENNAGDFIFCEQKERLGTGHAVKQASPYLPDKGKTLVLYSDVPLVSARSLKKLIKSAQRKKISILTTVLKKPKGYGRVVRSENSDISFIREEIDSNNKEKQIKEIFSGIMVVDNAFLKKGLKTLVRNNAAGEYYLTDLVSYAKRIKQKVGSCLIDQEEVLGANNKQELSDLYKAMVGMNIRTAKQKGTIFKDENTCYVEGILKVGKDVKIGNNVTLKGNVQLGDNVVIESNCLISNSKILEGSIIKDFCSIEDSKVFSNVEVGPFARLRSGAILDSSSKVGNFVEIKESNLSQNVKVNHLSYIGDGNIGKNSNIGAGTIFCNYDGHSKHKITIANNTFVGSNVSLVAPLKVGNSVVIGAGSTITNDIKDKELSIGRAKQINKKKKK